MWSSYGDAGGTIALGDALKLKLAGQVATQGSNGLSLLTSSRPPLGEPASAGAVEFTPGAPFSTFWAGARLDALWGPFTVSGAYTQVGSSAAWRSPYGIWIGYNKMQVLDFDRAGERAWQIGAAYDFAIVGLPGVAFLASATYGTNAVDATTGQRLSDNWEYDLELRFSGDRLGEPHWLKPLQLRARVAYVDSYLAGTTSSLTEYRVVLNYEVSWQGPRRR